jgi:hypothetical protein
MPAWDDARHESGIEWTSRRSALRTERNAFRDCANNEADRIGTANDVRFGCTLCFGRAFCIGFRCSDNNSVGSSINDRRCNVDVLFACARRIEQAAGEVQRHEPRSRSAIIISVHRIWLRGSRDDDRVRARCSSSSSSSLIHPFSTAMGVRRVSRRTRSCWSSRTARMSR